VDKPGTNNWDGLQNDTGGGSTVKWRDGVRDHGPDRGGGEKKNYKLAMGGGGHLRQVPPPGEKLGDDLEKNGPGGGIRKKKNKRKGRTAETMVTKLKRLVESKIRGWKNLESWWEPTTGGKKLKEPMWRNGDWARPPLTWTGRTAERNSTEWNQPKKVKKVEGQHTWRNERRNRRRWHDYRTGKTTRRPKEQRVHQPKRSRNT